MQKRMMKHFYKADHSYGEDIYIDISALGKEVRMR